MISFLLKPHGEVPTPPSGGLARYAQQKRTTTPREEACSDEGFWVQAPASSGQFHDWGIVCRGAVSRAVLRSERHEMDCTMDVNIDVYPVDCGMRLAMAWAKTIDLEGVRGPDEVTWAAVL